MTKKQVIFEMSGIDFVEWINNNPLTMTYLYALERAGILGGKENE